MDTELIIGRSVINCISPVLAPIGSSTQSCNLQAVQKTQLQITTIFHSKTADE